MLRTLLKLCFFFRTSTLTETLDFVTNQFRLIFFFNFSFFSGKSSFMAVFVMASCMFLIVDSKNEEK